MATLAQALKDKNKLSEKVTKFTKIIQGSNKVIAGSSRSYSVEGILDQLVEAKNELAIIKARIQKTNTPIQENIFKLSELKGLVSMLKKLDCVGGKQSKGYSDTVIEYDVVINELDRDNKIDDLQNEIDDLQSEIDQFNHTTELVD